jgi:hypothetical protein
MPQRYKTALIATKPQPGWRSQSVTPLRWPIWTFRSMECTNGGSTR